MKTSQGKSIAKKREHTKVNTNPITIMIRQNSMVFAGCARTVSTNG